MELYYEEYEREFYWVKETDKTILIDWAEKNSCDNEKTPLDFNVRWKSLKVFKNNKGLHCFKGKDEYGGILVYPNRSGQPFYLIPATIDNITSEIADCVKWGVSSDYYEKLKLCLNKE